MLIVQNRDNPAAVRNAIMDSLDESVDDLRLCSAYMTLGGIEIYRQCCLRHLSDNEFERIPKRIVTSVDFGLTDPAAIRFWMSLPNTEVRLAGAEMLANGTLVPKVAYHPKFYAFGRHENDSTVLVGSANLTNRGLTVNCEAVWQHVDVPRAAVDAAWQAACVGTVNANDLDVEEYAILREAMSRQEISRETEPVPEREITPPVRQGLPVFSTSVSDGQLYPESYSAMWVQVDQLQGGSRNQLELPRGAHRFFGFVFDHYDTARVEHIGDPVLVSGRTRWADRPLTWHGDNRMERINLPTHAQGGFHYEDSVILFRKLQNGSFELVVVRRDSDLARAWITSSSDSNRLYRLGRRTPRLSGFL